jgi:hypothetical protein
MKKLFLLIFFFSITINCQNVSYAITNENIANPERGFYRYTSTGSSGGYNLLSQSTLSGYRTNEGITVIQRQFFLRDFITGIPISTTYLTNMQTDFNRIRNAGAKVIVRFTYSSSSSTPVFQPSKAQILFHMKQLVNVLTLNKDVIVSIQAGFIGRYGEWYYTGSSEFGNGNFNLLTNTQWANRKEIVDYMINNFPVEIPIQLRYIYAKQKMYGNSYIGRIGFYNDSFLGTWGDSGTYNVSSSQGQPTTADITYWQTNTINNPVSGETNMVNAPRTDCSNAMIEMDRFNWSLINKDYFPTVISNWQTNGCFSEMQIRLGYKFELINSNVLNNNLIVSLRNTGYANLFKVRKVYLILINNQGVEYRYEIGNTSSWIGGVTTNLSIPLNYGIPTGSYKLYLFIPDNNNNNANYAIRFSNIGTWVPTKGYNDLLRTVSISAPIAKISVYDMQGVYVKDNLENLPKGIYIIKTVINDLIYTKKIYLNDNSN